MPVTLEKAKELLQVKELPGTPQQIQKMLKFTEELMNRNGEEWITKNRRRLIEEWEFVIQNIQDNLSQPD